MLILSFSTHLQIFDGLRRHSLSICGGDVIGKMLQTSMHNTQLILNRGGTGNPFKINLKLVKGEEDIYIHYFF